MRDGAVVALKMSIHTCLSCSVFPCLHCSPLKQSLFVKMTSVHLTWLLSPLYYRGMQPSGWACSLCSPIWSPEGQLSWQLLAKFGVSLCGQETLWDAAGSFPESLDTERRPHVPAEQIHSPHCPAWPTGAAHKVWCERKITLLEHAWLCK